VRRQNETSFWLFLLADRDGLAGNMAEWRNFWLDIGMGWLLRKQAA